MLNSEQGNHKRPGLSVYSCSQDQISSVGRDEKGTVDGHFQFRAGIISGKLGGEDN